MSEARIARLRGELASLGGDAMLVTGGHNRRYLTGFTGTAGVVLVTAGGAVLFTDFRYTELANAQAVGVEVAEHPPTGYYDRVAERLRGAGVQRLLFEDGTVSYAQYALLKERLAPVELVPAGKALEKLRAVKDATELAVIQEAADVADRTFSHILGYLKPGAKESDIALEMEFYMRKLGASGTSFDTIVASGERSAMPHGVASDRIIGPGEFVTLDFGASYKGYCSDLTRTVVVGPATERHKEIYGIVLEAQLHALAHLKPGITGREGDALTRDIITRYGYGDQYGHSTGHGIGLEIHEEPRLSYSAPDTILLPGHVVTVEPGIYVPGFGGVRIEDDVVLTDDGIKILTRSPKELIVLE
ncbi:Xaa-Pro peptidase family protein [Cohnella ginsengisoli]|uniref:Xaa-Pro peptidase family protein n=1 Tax=Cohnella ginsengisoli TaxID=425004 RepID=A0A9X4KD14_9BACL|nr:Xaa-Pro peptidase family protein [Cohnella ginsengisoli]MDG0789793.1 Xaa-Pro peptidase family protein [Cohnella ginsengisoli]